MHFCGTDPSVSNRNHRASLRLVSTPECRAHRAAEATSASATGPSHEHFSPIRRAEGRPRPRPASWASSAESRSAASVRARRLRFPERRPRRGQVGARRDAWVARPTACTSDREKNRGPSSAGRWSTSKRGRRSCGAPTATDVHPSSTRPAQSPGITDLLFPTKTRSQWRAASAGAGAAEERNRCRRTLRGPRYTSPAPTTSVRNLPLISDLEDAWAAGAGLHDGA